MTEKFFNAIYEELRPVLTENGFSEQDGVFSKEEVSFKVEYNEGGKVFELYKTAADGEWKAVTAYLFDEQSTLSDATAVGIDFVGTVSAELGIGGRKTRTVSEVSIPRKSDSENPGIEELTGKLLAIFPKYKDAYKEHVGEYGELLYVNFYLENFVPELREIIDSGNEKKLRKICDGLNELYCKGTRAVGDAVVVVLLGGAVKGDKEAAERVLSALSSHPHLKPAVVNIINRTARDKKLKEMYGI